MRYLLLDQWEFGVPDSEECIAFCRNGGRKFANAEEFFRTSCHFPSLGSAAATKLPPVRPLPWDALGAEDDPDYDGPYSGLFGTLKEPVTANNLRFLDHLLKTYCDYALHPGVSARFIDTDWNEVDVILEDGASLARLRWTTSA